ncbi:hypothetical protein EUX98_g5371 [Antrodiella citrinella]|uniref:Uncharacterized protein n=1 Tax=Antrodiella citrinella TaxID=2447956 RepID=A0A4V3XID8_9APHY|nr:hypothetical protein EUX98_g5371 [Antrodiella citrinella]
MAVLDPAQDDPVARAMPIMSELDSVLMENLRQASRMRELGATAKSRAIGSQTGFVLRRFNLDKSKDVYDAELERLNASMLTENQALMNDNKQLNALIKEYEQTLENVMATFRNRANEVQQRELTLIREYEHKLLVRETEDLMRQLSANSSLSTSLARLGTLLRSVVRTLNGEDPDSVPEPESEDPHGDDPYRPYNSSTLTLTAPADLVDGDIDDEKDKELAAAEWALERECELSRLEQENAHLRRLLTEHIEFQNSRPLVASSPSVPSATLSELPRLTDIPKVAARTLQSKLGGREVGPFGMYKKFDEAQ